MTACFSSSTPPPSADGLPPLEDGSVRDDAAAAPDRTAPDAAAVLDGTTRSDGAESMDSATPVDGTTPVDATTPTDGSADSAPESLDATVDAPPAGEAGADANLAETGSTTPADAGADASPIPVAGCIPDIPGGHYLFGDHYLRSDGKLYYDPNGTATLVTNAHTGLALLGVTAVTQQSDHACGLVSDGTVWCWPLFASGGNANGDLGNGTFNGTNLGIGAATQVVTSLSDAGAATYLTGAVHISTASDTQYTFPTCVIRSDRTLWCWGFSTAQTIGPDGLFWGSTGTTASVAVATPIAASAGDGGPPPTVFADQISVGDRHACVLADGKVSCWGQNVAGNLGIGNSNLSFQPYPVAVTTGIGLPTTVDEIGSGYDFSCARAGGSVWCWGTNSEQNVGNPGVASSICNSNYCVPTPAPVQQSALDGGATVTPDGGTNQSPLVNAVSLYVGYQFGCVLDTSSTIWCWGASEAGNTFRPEAQPFTSTQVPYTGINELTIYGEDSNTGLRYVTSSGQYVNGNRVFAPFCQ